MEQLPVFDIVKEWYSVLEETGKTRTESHRPCVPHLVQGTLGQAGSSGQPGSSGRPMGDATAADVELAEVDAAADAGHFARFGEPRPE